MHLIILKKLLKASDIMDTLIIGIDGGDQRIIEAMPMPYLKKILDEAKKYEIEEDLMSRGWAKILSGESIDNLGAFYNRPNLNRTFGFSARFSTEDHYLTKSAKPLWKLINDAGKSVGFMNIPTTYPAPKVNGFFISGAGGGMKNSGSKDIDNKSFYPQNVLETLNQNSYIFDIRFHKDNSTSFEELVEKLKIMITKRTETYLDLNNEYNVDLGFIAYMGTTRINYLSMFEIEHYLNSKELKTNNIELIKDLYAHFDKNIEKLIAKLKPKKIIIVSDHGMSPYRYKINLNAFLENHNLLKYNNKTFVFSARLFRAFFRRFLKKNSSFLNDYIALNKKSIAFGQRYISGIYINDFNRFGGTIKNHEVQKYVDEIIRLFNSSVEAKKYKLVAKSFKSNYNGKFRDMLPDIWIEHDDDFFFVNNGPFIRSNEKYQEITKYNEIERDMNSGIKSRFPILFVQGFNIEDDLNIKYNLNKAYEVIKKSLR